MPHLVDEHGRDTRLAVGMAFYKETEAQALYLMSAGNVKSKILWVREEGEAAKESFPLACFGNADPREVIGLVAGTMGLELALERLGGTTNEICLLKPRMTKRGYNLERMTVRPHDLTVLISDFGGTTSSNYVQSAPGRGRLTAATPEQMAEIGYYLAALAGLKKIETIDSVMVFTR